LNLLLLTSSLGLLLSENKLLFEFGCKAIQGLLQHVRVFVILGAGVASTEESTVEIDETTHLNDVVIATKVRLVDCLAKCFL